ncbi:hypothetical protein BU14_0410s0006 [Porphyra umbilicalis]|uniref:Uncharacterized protein n=1 Tax=Porphyra umbilicalis TaxID=2786 RepID=A0A1X6NVX0_PORUM|nr:hypothetical protein BU14_0410s0006 [Porphyra umbilicalis]|eukprot:OSX72722.1 hypothetical protein BU14_0410s0006 [Porphyra umbilicalis]
MPPSPLPRPAVCPPTHCGTIRMGGRRRQRPTVTPPRAPPPRVLTAPPPPLPRRQGARRLRAHRPVGGRGSRRPRGVSCPVSRRGGGTAVGGLRRARATAAATRLRGGAVGGGRRGGGDHRRGLLPADAAVRRGGGGGGGRSPLGYFTKASLVRIRSGRHPVEFRASFDQKYECYLISSTFRTALGSGGVHTPRRSR